MIFSAIFHEIQIATNFLQHQFYGNSAFSTIKNVFEQIFPFFSFIFCCFLHIICYIVADRKLWSSSCKAICSLSFPINSRSLYKTFFCFSEINDKIDFEMKVEGSPQFITSENEKKFELGLWIHSIHSSSLAYCMFIGFLDVLNCCEAVNSQKRELIKWSIY